jgi:8-oxo-dGTP pyrophosphatase MutT (NUDIX family)
MQANTLHQGNEMKPWSTLSSTERYRDTHLLWRTDTCITGGGHQIKDYHVFEYPDWVNAVVLTESFEIVLVRQFRQGAKSILLELPCGALNSDDSTPATGMLRELKEETGFVADKIVPLRSTYANPANFTNVLHSFLVWGARCDAQQSLDFGEEIEVVVTPFSNWLAKLINNDENLQPMHLMTALLAAQFLVRTDSPEWRTIRSEIKEIVCGELC